MITLIVNVRVKPGRAEDYAKISGAFGAHVEANRPGNILFRTYQKDDPLEFITVEHFEDEASLRAHQADDHTKATLERLRDILDGDLDVQQYGD